MQRILIWLLVVSAAILVVQTASTSWWMYDVRKEARQTKDELTAVVGKVQDDFRKVCTAGDEPAVAQLAAAMRGLSSLERQLAICDEAKKAALASEASLATLKNDVAGLTKSLDAVPADARASREAVQQALDRLPADRTWFTRAAGALDNLLACEEAPELCDEDSRLALAATLQTLGNHLKATYEEVHEKLPEQLLEEMRTSGEANQRILNETAETLTAAIDGPNVARRDLLSYARAQATAGASAIVRQDSLHIVLGRPTGFTCEDFDVAVGAYRSPADPALAPGVAWTDKILVDYLVPERSLLEFNYSPVNNLTIRKQLATEGGACVARIVVPRETAAALSDPANPTQLSVEILLPARHLIEGIKPAS